MTIYERRRNYILSLLMLTPLPRKQIADRLGVSLATVNRVAINATHRNTKTVAQVFNL